MILLRTGEVARYETLVHGLIPCRVVSIGKQDVTLRITRTRGAYKTGDEVVTPLQHAIPVTAVWKRKWKTIILPYGAEKTGPSAAHITRKGD